MEEQTMSACPPFEYDDVEQIGFEGRTFCLTGKFHHGPRPMCEYATEQAGGKVHKKSVKRFDYLVIGGRAIKLDTAKIKSALEQKAANMDTKIIPEEIWKRNLEAAGAHSGHQRL